MIWEFYPPDLWVGYFHEHDEEWLKFFIVYRKCKYYPVIQRIRDGNVICTMTPEPKETLELCKKQAQQYVERLLGRN